MYTLCFPKEPEAKAKIGVEDISVYGGASLKESNKINGETVVKISNIGNGFTFTAPKDFRTIRISYNKTPVANSKLSLYINDDYVRKLLLYRNEKGKHLKTFTLEYYAEDRISEGAIIKIQFDHDDYEGAEIDFIELLDVMPYEVEINKNEKYKMWYNRIPYSCPVSRSEFSGTIFTGRYAVYTHADTWYPTWGEDDVLYSPVTDGEMSGFCIGNPSPGHAKIEGENPLELSISCLGDKASISGNYVSGRYPCASLMYNDIWYYGTYTLKESEEDLAYFHPDWPVSEPFIGFRSSADKGMTWHDKTDPDRGIFENFHGINDESVDFDTSREIMITAPHFVDFGKNMKYAPVDSKTSRKFAYMVAHGANPGSKKEVNSFISGNNIYLLRILMPEGNNYIKNTEYLNNPDNWQYYSKTKLWMYWNRENLEEVYTNIDATVNWDMYLGNVSLTYNAPLRKYMMICSRADNRQSFSTILFESDNITGPYNIVHRFECFGPKAYFTIIPSKFISEDGLTAWLCFSANYMPGDPDKEITLPPNFDGAYYSFSMHEFRLLEDISEYKLWEGNKTFLNDLKEYDFLEAESGITNDDAHRIYHDKEASGGLVFGNFDEGRFLRFRDVCIDSKTLIIRYSTKMKTTLSFYVNEEYKQQILFESTRQLNGEGAYRIDTVKLSFKIEKGDMIEFRRTGRDGSVNLDYIVLI